MLYDYFRDRVSPIAMKNWIVGFSGGLDSTVLLDLCARYRDEEAPAPQLVAAHLQHGLRAEAEDDRRFCEAFCKERDIPFRSRRVEVGALADENGFGLEDAGRRARHDFFAELAAAFDPAVLLLAHHADDQAETILMRFLRGAGVRGLAGMQEMMQLFTGIRDEPVTVHRPLLPSPKSDLRVYADARGLNWREDVSNRDETFLRNRIRHTVLPLLEDVQPDMRAKLRQFGEVMGQHSYAIENDALDLLADHMSETSDGNAILRLPGELPAFPFTHLRAIENMIAFQQPGFRLSLAGHLALRHFLLTKRVGAVLELPGGLRLRRERDGVFVYEAGNEPLPPEGELILPEPPFRVDGLGVFVEAEMMDTPASIPPLDRDDPQVEWLDAAKLSSPLVLRARREGDEFVPLGAPGRKSVKNLLIDCKVPQREKAEVRVLHDAAGPVWVWPLRLAERIKLTPTTRRALRLTLRPL